MAEQSIGVLAAAMIQDGLYAEVGWLARQLEVAPKSLRVTLEALIADRKAKADDLASRIEKAEIMVPEDVAKLAPMEEKPVSEVPVKG